MGLAAGRREAGLPFYGKKIPNPRGGAGPSPAVLDEAQPRGLGGTGLGEDCDLLGFPGLGGPTLCKERVEVPTLEPQYWGWKGSYRHLVYPIFLFDKEKKSESQRVEEIVDSHVGV